MNTRFDQLVDDIQTFLKEDNTINTNSTQITVKPEAVQTFKDSVLVPMINKQPVDPVKMQEAIKAGVIEDHGDSVYTVTDPALQYVNKYPDLQGKFLPSQQAAAEQKRLKSQKTATSSTPNTAVQSQSTVSNQTPTTTRTTSTPSTNQAGVVSSVYKMQ